jgi:hypothetical protein
MLYDMLYALCNKAIHNNKMHDICKNGLIRNRRSKKNRQYNGQNQQQSKQVSNKLYTKNQRFSNTAPLNTWDKLKNSGSVLALLVTAIVLLLNDTHIVWYGNGVGHLHT